MAWEALRAIPYGETRSYADQATAYRAVANANGVNRISIVIPCHRIINSDEGMEAAFSVKNGCWTMRRSLNLKKPEIWYNLPFFIALGRIIRKLKMMHIFFCNAGEHIV